MTKITTPSQLKVELEHQEIYRLEVLQQKEANTQSNKICERCNERYCGNCSFSNGKIMAW
ncbi:hypothetical protein EHW64_18860 [Erwinia psidii]|uniref:hypothetical protein n=1 Tax=Erwinia psidii TaxID=69224 RepID=UPI00226B083B|nr:hypothetical protein [Erwinia psidii]MCX8963118.1 hypothetical protein [Erwinia psidii]